MLPDLYITLNADVAIIYVPALQADCVPYIVVLGGGLQTQESHLKWIIRILVNVF